MKKINHLIESIKNLKTVGTLKFSGPKIVNKVLEPVDFSKVKNIVEFGTGDACITREILDRMSSDSKLISFEINDKFYEMNKGLKDPRFSLIHDSAAELNKHCDANGIDKIDVVVSSIPVSLISKEDTEKIMKAMLSRLAPGGMYVQLQYSLVSKKVFEANFSQVKYSFTPLSVPPAFVYVCSNDAAA